MSCARKISLKQLINWKSALTVYNLLRNLVKFMKIKNLFSTFLCGFNFYCSCLITDPALQFLTGALQRQELSTIGATSLRLLCEACGRQMAQHYSSLVQLMQVNEICFELGLLFIFCYKLKSFVKNFNFFSYIKRLRMIWKYLRKQV